MERHQKISHLTILYKILHNVVSIPNHHIPTMANLRTRSHSQQLHAQLDVYLSLFFPSTLKV